MLSSILWYLCGSPGKAWAEHSEHGPFTSLSVTSDGFVTGIAMFVGSVVDLERNLRGVCDVVSMTDKERTWFQHQVSTRIGQEWAPKHINIL